MDGVFRSDSYTIDTRGPSFRKRHHRRSFSETDKRRIVEEAAQAGASLSEVARRYGIAARVLFRWKQELKPSAAPMFVRVQIADASAPSDAAPGKEERAP
jgi:transposase-like protein